MIVGALPESQRAQEHKDSTLEIRAGSRVDFKNRAQRKE
jgi:hypothetical protein